MNTPHFQEKKSFYHFTFSNFIFPLKGKPEKKVKGNIFNRFSHLAKNKKNLQTKNIDDSFRIVTDAKHHSEKCSEMAKVHERGTRSEVFRSIDVKRGCAFLIKPHLLFYFILLTSRNPFHSIWADWYESYVSNTPQIDELHFFPIRLLICEKLKELHRRNINQFAFDGNDRKSSNILWVAHFSREEIPKEETRRKAFDWGGEFMKRRKIPAQIFLSLFDYTNKFS